MAEVAGIFLSPFIQVFFERMASHEFVDFFRRRKLNDGLLMRLKMTLLSVNAVLEDAEYKQFTKPDVKEWLDELKDAVYDAEDILDEIPTKDLRQKLDAEFGTIASKVRSPISTSRFVKEVERKIEELLERLKFLVEQKGNIGLREGGNPSERLPTTSLIEESSICGRNYDKEAIIKLLLSDDGSGSEICVIVIVGMGGIGKTTIAQLVYNDNRVKEHFDLEIWVCISDLFDVFIVMKTILEEVGSPANADSKNLNQLQSKLKEMLSGKKFLLVLDDVWEKNNAKWEVLSNAFKFGAQGSKVIVTTRDQQVASVMYVSVTHRIMELPEEDCWSLFAKYAFHDGSFDAYPELEAIGRQIVEKCKGLPLAIKAIGALLRSKLDVDEWDKVLRSELWDLPIEETCILPALGLSYKYLSSNLKRCFAYCSILPKDYAFKKDKLVLLWMAEGFLPQSKTKTMEEVGDDYFLTLVSRSLFQQSNGEEYIMHDLVRDLAKFISKQFALSHEDDFSRGLLGKTRHFSYSWENIHAEKFEALRRAKKLRTFVELNFLRDDLSLVFGTQFLSPMTSLRLRALILSNYANITELPDSIGKLIHLRYLDVSFTAIKRLPHFICKLCNLQILNLSHCPYLAALPRDMHKLINLQILNLSHCPYVTAWPRDMHKLIHLRHLDFDRTNIMGMPKNLGELKCLQTLTSFMVSKHNGSCIGELGKLTNLRGSLSILELQNVKSPMNANDGCLRDVKYLEKLVLGWKVGFSASESHKIVLDSLRPHTNLKSLIIYGYGGKSFSNWVGHASFSNIASLRLDYCNHCCSLPMLGQLPSLQDLSIVGLSEIVIVGREFYGIGSSSIKPFGALKVLSIEYMEKLEELFCFENDGGAFPNLRELEIYECPMLTRGLPIHLPSLAKLKIRDCPQLVASALFELDVPIHLEYLMLDGCHSFKSIPLELFPKLRHLEIRFCGNLKDIKVQKHLRLSLINIDIHGCPKLRDLEIYECPLLTRGLPIHLPSLAKLKIRDCPQLVASALCELDLPIHLEYLMLDGCHSFKSIPLDLFPKLRHLEIRFCGNLESIRVQKHHEHDLLLSLINIDIHGCPNFAYFPKEGLRSPNLKEFRIENCRGIRSLPDKMHILLPSLAKLCIKDCPEVESFPEGGLPSNLEEITISDCEKLFARRMEWDLKNFPSIRIFKIIGKSEDVESFPDEGLLPTSLTYLHINGFQHLRSLGSKGLQYLNALEELEIESCPKLECMPEDRLPASLSTLNICNCPLLEKEWERKEGEEWSKIAHVPRKSINFQLI